MLITTTPGRNLRRFQLGKKHYISLIAGYILLKKNNQVLLKPNKRERSRVVSWPFLFQERSFKTMVGSSTNKQRSYDQAKKSQATCLGFFAFWG
ncbi:hypothetical protein, partial [Leptospira interrogans]|uniref:hypothetical protein n=1 Tax=Leptospira interrogans TaxID=173 RepID=UPI001CA5AB8C